MLSLTIGMPTYNGARWVGEALQSIFSQSFQDFEIVVSDDGSTDNTIEVIKGFGDRRIKIFRNKENLGYGKNLQVLRKHIPGDILFLMAQDDVLLEGALSKTYQAFLRSEDIGAVTRPYYWFEEDFRRPVRAVLPYDAGQDRVISIFDGRRDVQKIFESVGQLSGLAYRVKYMNTDFHEDTFPAHIYPFASISKKHKVVFLKDYTVAVRIASSQTRFKSSIYDISPTASWVQMFNTVYRGEKYRQVRETGIEQMATNFVGLLQLKNFSTFKNILREVIIMVKLRPCNLLSSKFWFFGLGAILVPRRILLWLVDNYKSTVLARVLNNERSL